jgi:cytoskeletal protein RodZ
MNSFFLELQQAREAKNISLAEVSDATLINMKILEALERGDTGTLPEAYVRAFIRGYAGAIGLDKDATIARYDAIRNSQKPAAHPVAPTAAAIRDESVAPPLTKYKTEPPKGRARFFSKFKPILVKIGIAIVVLVLIDLALWNILNKEPVQAIQETPFRDVIREQEKKAGLADTAAAVNTGRSTSSLPQTGITKDSVNGKPVTVPPKVVLDKDSLTLVATTSDSVWLQIVVDDDNLTEHYLLPHSTMQWRAKNEFWISAIGNPAAIKFALNNKSIPIPVRPGFVTRDVRLNRESLQSH